MLRSSRQEVLVLWVVLAGCCMVLLWADAFDLGVGLPSGQVMSVALVAGPLLGISFMLLSCLLSLWMANLLDPTHRSQFDFRLVIPPFPLKKILWGRLLGPAGMERLLDYPILKQWRWLWSWLLAASRRIASALGDGRVGYGSLLAWHSGIARAWIPVALLLWLQHFILDVPALVPGHGLQALWLLATLPFIGLFAYQNAVAIDTGFGLGRLRSVAIVAVAWILSLGILLFLLSFLTGIRLI